MSKKALYITIFSLCGFAAIFYTSMILTSPKKIKILSFDGGGMRGTASLEILKTLQEDTGLHPTKHFDVFAGTSTGSIIAVLLACGMDVEELAEAYEQLGSHVFAKKYLGLFEPKYDSKPLKNNLLKLLNACGFDDDALLSDIPKKVVIPTVCLQDSKMKYPSLKFRENISKNGGKVKIIDALMESTAAPSYFPSYNGYVDGGIGMKDPSLAALIHAYDPKNDRLENFTLLSIGTGYQRQPIKDTEDWGLADWIIKLSDTDSSSHSPLITILMDVGAQVSPKVCAKLLGKTYIKIDFPLDEAFPLDNYKDLDKLIAYTESAIEYDEHNWKMICDWILYYIK